MVLGVAGKYCSGKNTLIEYLKPRGFRVIDADLTGHRVLQDQKDTIVRVFGSEVLDASGDIDRKVLGGIVFRRQENRGKLEAIVHPEMVRRITADIGQPPGQGNLKVIINAAILFRMGLHKLCDSVIIVEASTVIRFLRAIRRDHLSISDTARRILCQGRIYLKLRKTDVDIYRIRNNGNIKKLKKKILKFCREKGI